MSRFELITMQSTDLVTQINANTDLTAEEKKDLLSAMEQTYKEQMTAIKILPKIKIAPGGINQFLMGEEEKPAPTLRAVILYAAEIKAYWHKAETKKNAVPLQFADLNEKLPFCFSQDGMTGSRPVESIPIDGKDEICFGSCADCYLNRYGTAVDDSGTRGKGKACKNGYRLVVMLEGNRLPHALTLPPTSIKAYEAFITGLTNRGQGVWQAVTNFELEKKEDGQRRWSVVKLSVAEILDVAAIGQIYKFRRSVQGLATVGVTEDEFTPETNGHHEDSFKAADFEVVEDEKPEPAVKMPKPRKERDDAPSN